MFSIFLFVSLFIIKIYSQSQQLYAVVGYCPTPFTSEGAVITVDSITGDYDIKGRFQWPSEIFGCLYEYDPTVTFDPDNHMAYLQFIDEFGFVIEIDLEKAKIIDTITPKDLFYVGFINMDASQSNALLGLTPNVEKNGLCDDGCFQFGSLNTKTGDYKGLHDIYFKAMMDNVHYFDTTNNIWYVQGSYDLNYSYPCAARDSDECMISINTQTGKMINAIGPNNYTVYAFTRNDTDTSNVLSLVFGFEDTCKHPYNDYAFANVNLKTASAELLICLNHSITLEDSEWTTFNNDGSLFANAVGDTETTTQVLIVNSTTGNANVNTDLPGLGKKLPAYLDLYVIWGITF